MQKLVIALILTIICLSAQAQKKDVPHETKKYEKRVVIQVSDYQNLLQALSQYKRLCVYDPAQTAGEKVVLIQNIESYTLDLQNRIRVDSVEVIKSQPLKP
jgi:cell division protein FtsL